MNWFDVSKEGLAKILDRYGRHRVIAELISNSFDADAQHVSVVLEPVARRAKAVLTVTDDSEKGFQNLNHSWTLFAESSRKEDVEKRGRFNLGEKLALSICETASIVSTKGGVRFDAQGRTLIRQKTDKGTVFSATIDMNREQIAEALDYCRRIVPPKNIALSINGDHVRWRTATSQIEAPLQTEKADDLGYLKPTVRKTLVKFYEIRPGEEAYLYEMGIPVVPMSGGERWHVDVSQKIPLNMDRDNVTPSYFRTVRSLLLNTMKNSLKEEDATQPWASHALEHADTDPEAAGAVIKARFNKPFVADPP